MNKRFEKLDSLSPEEKRRLLEEMLRKPSASPTAETVKPSGFRFPEEYNILKKQFSDLEQTGFGRIYFTPSSGINANTITIEGRSLVNYAGYNYLGMSGDPVVSDAAKTAIDRYGTSVSASRLVSGEKPLHGELERAMAGFMGAEDCIVFVGGYVTNETVIGHLMGSEDLIVHDSLIHASIQGGCKLSGAAIRPFPHNNWQALDNILQTARHRYRQVLIVIEGVYSMDGDIPDLPAFIRVKQTHDALLMVDEAHSMGVLGARGAGIGEYHGVNRESVDLWMGTLSKSFASCGGYIAGQKELIEYLRFTVPGFVYSVGMTPPNTASALAALKLLEKEPQRVKRLRKRADLFLSLAGENGFNTGNSRDSAVIPVILGQSLPCVKLYKALFDRGIFVLPIMYPAVPEDAARLRFFINCAHTEEQIRDTIRAVAECLPDVTGYKEARGKGRGEKAK